MNKGNYRLLQTISALLITAFVIQSILVILPAQAARPTQQGEEKIYAPFVSAGISAEITINSPKANSLVAGSFIFSAQPLHGGGVNSVDFFAGNTLLGTDDSPDTKPDGSPENGFSIDLDSSELPDGQVILRAVADGTRDAAAQITVTNVPNPAQQTTANQSGAAVAASQIGSVIMVPPGGLPAGATMTVTELMSNTFGIQWDQLGITFLGAQEVESSAPLEKPLAVSSAGFAPRVQPNQAVVNYNLAPDADGDGVPEIVVVNTARVAGADVVSDPLPEVAVGEVTVAGVSQGLAYAAQAGLHGPPGTILEFEVTGFNLYSPLGNFARFKSAVDDTEYEARGMIRPDVDDPSRQRFSTLIPPMPPGAATLTLVNLSTMDTSGPIAITIDAGPALELPPIEIIDDALAMTIDHIHSIILDFPTYDIELNELATRYSELRDELQTLNNDPSPAAQQFLEDMAKLIQASGIQEQLATSAAPVLETEEGAWSIHPASADATHCITPGEDKGLHGANMAAALIGGAACLFSGPIALACIGLIAGGFIIDTIIIDTRDLCTPPPPPCRPSGGGRGPTGMGSAPPPGGNFCGGGGGGGGGSFPFASTAATSASFVQEMGRIKVVVLSDGERTPFTGSTDRGGYFFVPFVPQDKPFTAYAIDTVTGQVRSHSGIGPPTGESVWAFFDFDTGLNEAIENRWTGKGDGVNWEDAQNWSLERLPGPIDKVVIDLETNPTINFNSSAAVNSVEIAEALTVAGGNLQIVSPSSISGKLTMQNGELVVNSELTLAGLLEWTGGTISGEGTLKINGDAMLSGASQKRFAGLTVENNSTFVLGGTAAIAGGQGTIFNNQSGAIFDFASEADYDGFNLGGGGTTFNNSGTVRKSGAALSFLDAIFNNQSSLVEVQTGILELRHGGNLQGGAYTVANGTSLDLAGTVIYTMTGTLSGNGAGQVRGIGGTLTTSGTATLNFPNGGFGFQAGRFESSGEITLQGKFLVSGTATKIINGVTLNNEGLFQLSGPGDIVGGRGATFNNKSGATFDIAADASYRGFDQGGGTTFNNSGTVRKSGGTATSNLEVVLNNQSSLVEVQMGTIELPYGGNLQGGTYTVANGSFLDLTGNRIFTMTGTLNGDGAGQVRNAGAILTSSSTATLNFPNGGFGFQAGRFEGSGEITLQGDFLVSGTATKIINGVTLNNEGLFQLSGTGIIAGGRGAIFNNESGATFDFASDASYQGADQGGDTIFNNSGTLRKSAGVATSDLEVNFNNQSGLVEVQAGTLNVQRGGSLQGGTYTIANNAFLNFATGDYLLSNTLTGAGLGQVRLAGASFMPDTSATINLTGGGFVMTSGSLEGPGTLTFQGVVTLSGAATKSITGLTVNNGAVWTWIGPGNIHGGGAAIFNNQATATFDARTSGANMTYIGDQFGGGDTTFNNNGAVIKSGDGFVATLDLCYNGTPPVGVIVIDCP